jgi:multisubunit Na+/H+ antiporter MnhE subunit
MSFFYIGLIALTTWYAGKNSRLALSFIAGAVLIFIARATGQEFSHPAILYWNTLLQIASYVFIFILISKVHASLILEKKLARVDALTNIPNRLKFIEQLNS